MLYNDGCIIVVLVVLVVLVVVVVVVVVVVGVVVVVVVVVVVRISTVIHHTDYCLHAFRGGQYVQRILRAARAPL